jgi:hypothetical protein
MFANAKEKEKNVQEPSPKAATNTVAQTNSALRQRPCAIKAQNAFLSKLENSRQHKREPESPIRSTKQSSLDFYEEQFVIIGVCI